MPSNKKRINLTIPDDVYELLQEWKKENGVERDASACLQLLVCRLNSFSVRYADIIDRIFL